MRRRTASRQRSELVIFERPIARKSAMGREPASDYDRVCEEYVQVRYGTGAERRTAGAEGALQSATFIALDNALTRLVTVRDTIWAADRRWNITSVAPIAARGEIEFGAATGKG